MIARRLRGGVHPRILGVLEARHACRNGYAAFLPTPGNFFRKRKLKLEHLAQTADFERA
jgi:hypothetical protein